MKDGPAPVWVTRLVGALVVFTLLTVVVGAFALADALSNANANPNSTEYANIAGFLQAMALVLAVGGLGVLVVARSNRFTPGLLLVAFAAAFPWIATGSLVADATLVRDHGPAWLGVLGTYLSSLAILAVWCLATFFLLWFPTGTWVSPRWRIVGWATAVGAGLLAFTNFDPRLISSDPEIARFIVAPSATNPLGIAAVPEAVFDLIFLVGILVLYAVLFAAIGSLVVRYRRSTGEVRQQLKVVAFGIVTFAVAAVVLANLNPLGGVFSWLFEAAVAILALVVLASFGVALLKYRLYDIDVVINKAILYGLVVVFISVMFAVVAFVPFLVLDGGDDGRNLADLILPMLATLVIVLLFQPVRERAQRAANRLVYGRRATPYEALSRFSATVARSSPNEELLSHMATILAEGTGAPRAQVWIRSGDSLNLEAFHPGDDNPDRTLTVQSGSLPRIPGMDIATEVTHQGEFLGAVAIAKRQGDPLRPIERRLMDDLASQAGVVLRNFQLNDELRQRLDQLRTSRQRLVTAQDEERRRLERNLHDGAQQQLVALKMRLALLDRIDAVDQPAMVAALMAETDDAIQNLRELARGIYPPALSEQGLVRALRGQAAKSPIQTEVSALGVRRYAPELEAAVYFCTLEALQNASKYSHAEQTRVILTGTDDELTFEIRDNGRGFDHSTTNPGTGLQNMTDRIEALGGVLTVTSTIGVGTTISGSVPIGALEEAAHSGQRGPQP